MSVPHIPINCLGRILTGAEAGRVIEIFEDQWGTGSYFIFTYADFDRSDVDDTVTPDRDTLQDLFEINDWHVSWIPTHRAA
jgi:hypothetical protein